MFDLIGNYINKMNKEDIKSFLEKNNILLDDNELNFTYLFIIKNWRNILSNPNSFNFNNYKDKYSEDNFIKLNKLINNYRYKYNI